MDNNLKKSIISYLEERFEFKTRSLNFRFPISTLADLLKNFFKDFDHTAFLVEANGFVDNLSLKRIYKSYLLKIPIENYINEHMYVGMSDMFSFLVLFDEPKQTAVNSIEKKSRFFLSFDHELIKTIFNYFYRNYCDSLDLKEKKLLIKLKNVKSKDMNPYYVSKFQEALLINTLNYTNMDKQAKIVEAISFTDELVLITDLAGFIKETNKNFTELFKFTKNITNIKEILPANIIDDAIKNVSTSNKWNAEIKINLNQSANKPILFIVSCYLFKDELNKPNGYVFTLKDVTNLRRLNSLNKQLITKLRERNVQLSEANKRYIQSGKIKSDLLSVVSHELKTPVSTIIGFSELITTREYDKETIKSFAKQINVSAKELEKLINDYLDVAGNDFGVAVSRLNTSPINIADLIKVVYDSESSKFADRKFHFELNMLGIRPVILTEASNMQKLFSNLINNALKYSPDGGVILVKILNDGENVTISITDSGIGITAEEANQVFEPFYRADNSLTRKFSGIGLGLSLCKKIVEIYNGSIWCEPAVVQGTAFYVTLPVNPHKPKSDQSQKQEKNINASREETEKFR